MEEFLVVGGNYCLTWSRGSTQDPGRGDLELVLFLESYGVFDYENFRFYRFGELVLKLG